MKKKSLFMILLTFLLLFGMMSVTTVAANAAEVTSTASKKPGLNTKKMIFYVGGKTQLKMQNIGKKKVKWSSANPQIATVNSKGKVTAKKIGKTKILAKVGKKTYKCSVTVLSNAKFLKSWCKTWAKEWIEPGDSDFDKVLTAAYFVGNYFRYGSAKDAFDVLIKGRGTCVSANKLLVEMLKNMGFTAKLRFAAKDNMSRYPWGVFFMSQHHNVKVKIKGKWYYADGTPGVGCLYLSSETEPIYYANALWGSWQVEIDKIPGHSPIAQETTATSSEADDEGDDAA